MKKHRRSSLVIILLMLVAIATAYVGSTYAKYTETVSGDGTATVAKWDFTTDNAISNLTINFTNSYDATTLVAGKIAPGMKGSYDLVVQNTSEVTAEYTIAFELTNASNVKNTNTETGVNFTIALGTVTNIPTNLKFYKDSTFSTQITPGTDTITGQLAAKDGTGLSVPIYWKWEYETTDGDDEDTTDGKAATVLTIPVTITGTQVPPSSTAITSHINS